MCIRDRYEAVAAKFDVVRLKNRFASPTFCGFRDMLVNVSTEATSARSRSTCET